MESELNKEAPNVVTEPRFRKLIASGYLAEVVCQVAAYRKASVWYGEWIIRVVNSEGTFEKLLVTTPRRVDDMDEIKVRVFKTINGLSSFMHEAGFAHLDIPFFSGGRTIQSVSEKPSKENRS
ncbi:hypothetical protein [Paracoccus rhizosphaerae]|uniref:Uncharacterized protein n=1 Tax=Paracoccus rhizosphaerae TaxID=1133347 RepID=A0ABV6CIQ6_9RHOB|nr:hypothetical protein [Paracoccus rhizosphaerae]